MAKLEVRTPRSKGSLTMEDTPLGKGGEGAVYSVLSHSVDGLPPAKELVVKIYHSPMEGNRREKIISMVSAPPNSTMFAWPLALAARNGLFVGFVMEKLNPHSMKEWAHLAHTKTRREIAREFDVRYAIAACLNLAIATQAAHSQGHVLGDILNESNAAVGSDASIVLLDTDSAQIKGKDGRVFRCEVGKPEYTAAELIGRPLREQDRTVATDSFAFGVLFFQMLTGGAHQTDGIYTGSEDAPSTISKISQCIVPMLRDESSRGFKPVPRIAVAGIPSQLKALILQLSEADPQRRPSFEQIIQSIREVQANLEQCSQDSAHWYDKRDAACGWCEHANSGQPDPWGEPQAQLFVQSTLPPVSFGQQSKPTGQAPRAAVNSAKVQSGYGPTAVQQSYSPSPASPSSNTASSPIPPPRPQINSQQLSPLAQQILQQANGQASQVQQASQQLQQAQLQQAAFQQSQQKPSQPSQQAPEPQKIPDKIKGKMTVVYKDGSYGPRPPMSVLFTQNNRLWRKAIATEWPGFLKLWWPRSRPIATAAASYTAPIVAALTLTLVLWLSNAFLLPGADRNVIQVVVPLLTLGMICSSVAFLFWWIGCWTGRARAKKEIGDLDRVVKEPVALTLLRAFGITVSYLFTPVLAGVAILVALIKTMIRGDKQNRYR